MRLRSCVAVAVVGGYSSDSTPGLGPSICGGCDPKKTNRQTKQNKTKNPKPPKAPWSVVHGKW